ncbi:hypothetical protein Amsp01_027360 [Amycolatopsis sp. NBRC 101858]|uniref:Asp23/Gls24 family envelope stress response protein n=1 Tax=Amycolatopsis sp. NBRC 101858 TaxID=3032200 RepID=UPI0024A3EB00|nr:Asp23/Gls24 family envelope stress response protein [Amycolatopsis sp. NBRC 101858]GLY36712.1 hypothetical protein Amsp01_027360 [Amycolatopsis sp. NBRC 101858]
MSDVINSIFGRAQNETPSSEGYGYGNAATETAETVDADATETVEDATETEDAADETADVDEADDSAEAEEDAVDEESDEAVADAVEESDEDTDTADEAVADDTADEAVAEEAEETPAAEAVVAEAEAVVTEAAEEAGARPAAGTRGSTTVADGVVSKIVIRVARKAEGVYELDEAGTSVEVEGEVATIAVTLVVEFGRAVKALAEQIRVQLVEAVEDYLGLEVASVDVHVADIHFPDAD